MKRTVTDPAGHKVPVRITKPWVYKRLDPRNLIPKKKG